MPPPRRPLRSRPLDILYFTFFLIHIPIMLLIDLVPFYPAYTIPGFVTSIRRHYVEVYKDRFFVDPPAWFMFYLEIEGVYGLPLGVWAAWGVWNGEFNVVLFMRSITKLRICLISGCSAAVYAHVSTDHPLVPLQLLIWAVQVATTTATCVVDFMNWEGVTTREQMGLAQLYVPYLALGTYCLVIEL